MYDTMTHRITSPLDSQNEMVALQMPFAMIFNYRQNILCTFAQSLQ
jgi:hypothetical protein